MKAFSQLLERLAFTAGRNAKLQILQQYFATTPDPDRGYALGALTDLLALRHASPALLKQIAAERVDERLFRLSYDFVGDLAETIALIWPEPSLVAPSPPLSQIVTLLQDTPRAELAPVITGLLDRLPAGERFALLKLITGNLRVGVSQRLAHMALVQGSARSLDELTALWHGLRPPFTEVFRWLAGGAAPPPALAPFTPVMLATPITPEDLVPLDPQAYVAEWKWDGIRVQAVSAGGERRLYSRSGEEISAAFPDIIAALDFEGVLDGELLVRREGAVAAFADLQKRLGRKTVSAALLRSHPAALRAYDLLHWQGEDLRALPLQERRKRLESIDFTSPRIDLSPHLPFATWDDLARLRAAPREAVIEGVMIKRLDSIYVSGRPRGPWFKWKRDPMVIDAVLLYAQAGHGKRSGFYSDFTFGVWQGEALVPVGKAYSGFSDAELKELDRFVRKNTTQRFGPVRQLAPHLVVEVAFEGINRSARHRSGVALRFPRISRIRWDKPAAEADHLENVMALL